MKSLVVLVLVCVISPPLTGQTPADSLERHRLGADYGYVYFEGDIEPWQLASLSLRGATPLGSLIGRVNYADRFGESGVQVEADAYPRLPGATYAYLNAGYALSGLFPDWRFGGELYANLPGAWEISAGGRHLRFEESAVTLYTGSLGRYVGNSWVSLRSFVRPKNGSVSASGILTGRRYFADADNYVGASVGYGTTPSDRATAQELERNSSISAGFHGSKGLGPRLFGTWSVGYEREELAADRLRNRWDVSAGVQVEL